MERELHSTTKYVVFLGEAGFPLGFAAIQRMTLIARSLIHVGCQVLVICRKGVWEKNVPVSFGASGNFQGVDFIYTSKSGFKPKGFLNRNVQKLFGIYREFRYLSALKKQNKLDVAIVSTMSSFHVLRYRVISRMIGFPVVLNFVELASSMIHRDSIPRKINDYIFDHFIVKTMDGALPISNKLLSYYEAIAPAKPCMKLPILCDFEEFQISPNSGAEVVLLYCGAASYRELIEFVIDAFDRLTVLKDNVFLDLILGGEERDVKKIKDRIAKAKNNVSIRVFNNLPREEIPERFSKASALLIPLRPTVQDEARFPHKIGEYLASGTPMITTAYGEIKNYNFIDEENSLIAGTYQVDLFSDKMQFIIDNPTKAKNIGHRGRELGLQYFEYSRFGTKLKTFLSTVKVKEQQKR